MILAILQARMSSTRLPGKVLKPLLGRPMLERQLERIRRASKIDRIVVATSQEVGDDTLAAFCRDVDVACVRGSLDDVLDRFYRAAVAVRPDHVVRLTGDCPLTDPTVLDRLIELHLSEGSDYSSTSQPPTFPDGLDAEIMTFACLERAWREATLPSQREHVTPFIYQHPELFRCATLRNEQDLSQMRWTVDEPADFAFVSRIYEALYPRNPAFGMRDVLAYLAEHEELTKLNSHFERNAGYMKSLAKERTAQSDQR